MVPKLKIAGLGLSELIPENNQNTSFLDASGLMNNTKTQLELD